MMNTIAKWIYFCHEQACTCYVNKCTLCYKNWSIYEVICYVSENSYLWLDWCTSISGCLCLYLNGHTFLLLYLDSVPSDSSLCSLKSVMTCQSPLWNCYLQFPHTLPVPQNGLSDQRCKLVVWCCDVDLTAPASRSSAVLQKPVPLITPKVGWPFPWHNIAAGEY